MKSVAWSYALIIQSNRTPSCRMGTLTLARHTEEGASVGKKPAEKVDFSRLTGKW